MAANTTSNSKESIVKTELEKFLQKNGLQEDIDTIDEVVLSYVISILEDLGDDSNAEDNIDVEQFVEMMDAYIPGFLNVNSIHVVEWMFDLSSKLSNRNANVNISIAEDQSYTDVNKNETQNSTEKHIHVCENPTSTQSNEQSNSTEQTDQEEEVKFLLEMFPTSCTVEVIHCLGLAKGDTDVAVQLILERQDQGISLKPKREKTSRKARTSEEMKLLDDKNLRQLVIDRYAYQDADEDKKTFSPVAPKQEPKKLVRYLDGRVVSTKGEKFTEIKKEEIEDMKKTYINLKPARKYRFH